MEKIIPEIIKDDKRGFKTVDYVKVIPILTEGIKALNEKINQQKKEIETIHSKINRIYEL